MIKRIKLGFTLVELLVAIAIFAVLSALGWKVFDYIGKVKTQNAMHEIKLGQLQEAYQQILRDTVQAVPLTVNIDNNIQPAFVLQDGKLNFSKTGVTDPLNQGIAPDERIEYQYRQGEQKLYRLKYRNINQTGQDQPDSSVLLEGVEQYQVLVLNPNELTAWPDSSMDLNTPIEKQRMPRGIKMNLTVNGVSYEWMYSLLNTDFLNENNKPTNDGNKGGTP